MLKESALRSLKALLSKNQVFTDGSALIAYEADGGIDRGTPEGVVFPRTAVDVALIMRWSSEHGVPLVARGAGTGLSGGAVADRGGVIVDFAHMNSILDFDAQGRSAVVEPALINLRLDERAKAEGLYFPPDPSSQRASTIGGNVAENSGGPHCFKYGVTTNYITGLDVVLADGRRMRVGGRALDYPEYDLCGLITGSEGMLALITSIAVRLRRNPPGVKTMLAIFDTPEQAGKAVSAVIAAGLVPATMEMMDQKITRMIEPYAQAGLPLDAGAILIIEVDGYPESLDAQIEEIAQTLRAHGVREMRFASNEEERTRIWLARKSMAGGVTRLAPAYYTVDITVPRSRLAEMLIEVDKICERHSIITGHVMHAGDGNLHPLLLIPDPSDEGLMRRILAAGREIVQCCVEMGGSLTGEHGVGIEKREYMSLMHNPTELMAMWDIKQTFDPQGLLNPGKVFPPPRREEDGPFAGYGLQQTDGDFKGKLPQPGETFAPSSVEEAARGLLALSEAGQHVQIQGCVSSHQQRVRVSTSALRAIKKYAPDDMYIIVGAGTTLTEVQDFLRKDRKQVALVSPWPEATIGGLIAANINAPLRMRYGAVRDQVLYTKVALADGRAIRTGRPIVKNVAGYDLTKALIGSHGTLGLITEVGLKLIAQPRIKRSLLVPVEDLRHGLIWARQIMPLALTASAITLSKGYQTEETEHSNYSLTYTIEGLPGDVDAEIEQVRQTLQVSGAPTPYESLHITGSDIWAEMLGGTEGKALQVRVGVPARELPSYIQDQSSALNEGAFLADMSSGFVYAIRQPATGAAAWLEALRQPALAKEGYAVVMGMPENLQEQIDRWGYQPGTIEVMRTLKSRWDSRGILESPEGFLRTTR